MVTITSSHEYPSGSTATSGTATPWSAMVVGAALGVLAFSQCLPFAIVDPREFLWTYSWGIDVSANYAGWHMFRYAPWTWPLGAVTTFGYPIGSSVALTDSIPLLAIPLKLAGAALPTHVQYFGAWLLACYILQGIFGALLMRLATPRVPLQVLGAALFVMSPTLLHRLGHISLCAHWLLLASLYLHLGQRDAKPRRWFAAWVLVAAAAAGTHAYLSVMVTAVAGAAVIAGLADRDRRRWALGLAVALPATTLLGWWAAGFFIVSNVQDLYHPGLGLHSMNLWSPLIPSPGALLEGRVPFSIAWPAQDDGFVYFGLGVLLLAAAAAVLAAARRVRWRGWTATGASLTAACVLLTVVALGPTVMLGSTTVFEYDPSWWGPLSVFRASGRMIWPVYYAVVFGFIAIVVRGLGVRAATLMLGAAVLVQAADLQGAFHEIKAGPIPPTRDPLISPFWDTVLPRYRHVALHPSNMCVPYGQGIDYRFFVVHAGPARVTLNGGHAIRYDLGKAAAYCRAFAEDRQAGRVADDTLYVVYPALVPAMLASSRPVTCVPIDGYGACFTIASAAAWLDAFDVSRQTLPPLDSFRRFRERLEADYRDRMRRPAVQHRTSTDDRLQALTAFLAYRVDGCGYDEALSMAMGVSKPSGGVRLCSGRTFAPGPLPPAAEALKAVQDVEKLVASQSGATHVDVVGEATWTHAYAELRRRGRSEAAAIDEVLAAIRAIAP